MTTWDDRRQTLVDAMKQSLILLSPSSSGFGTQFHRSIPVSIIYLLNSSGNELNRNQPVAICVFHQAPQLLGWIAAARSILQGRKSFLMTQGDGEGVRSRTTGPTGLVQATSGEIRRRLSRLSVREQGYVRFPRVPLHVHQRMYVHTIQNRGRQDIRMTAHLWCEVTCRPSRERSRRLFWGWTTRQSEWCEC